MSSWNVLYISDREFQLLNGSQTLITLSPKSKFDVTLLMSKLEEIEFPLSYTKGLKLIHMTKLPGTAGDYLDCRIRMSSDKLTQDIMDVVFVHEVAHHIDDIENVTDDEHLKKEKKKKAKFMPDGYAKKNVGEYFATGFEVFYCGTKKEKSNMRKKNPRLFSTISALHKKFSDDKK